MNLYHHCKPCAVIERLEIQQSDTDRRLTPAERRQVPSLYTWARGERRHGALDRRRQDYKLTAADTLTRVLIFTQGTPRGLAAVLEHWRSKHNHG